MAEITSHADVAWPKCLRAAGGRRDREAEQHERMERVIGSHLERFGKRDGLSVSWGA